MTKHYHSIDEILRDVKNDTVFFTVDLLSTLIDNIEKSPYVNLGKKRIDDFRSFDKVFGRKTLLDIALVFNSVIYAEKLSTTSETYKSLKKKYSEIKNICSDYYDCSSSKYMVSESKDRAERYIEGYYSEIITFFREETYIVRKIGILKLSDEKSKEYLEKHSDKLYTTEHLYYINLLDKEYWGRIVPMPEHIVSKLEQNNIDFLILENNLVIVKDSEKSNLKKLSDEFYETTNEAKEKYDYLSWNYFE